MTSKARAWVLPSVFALLAASLPVQMAIADRLGEPYPGLFQPAFRTSDQPRGTVRITVVRIAVDGRAVDVSDLFPGGNVGHRRALLTSVFPTHQGDDVTDDALRSRLRANLVHTLGSSPRALSVTWRRSTYHLATGSITDERVLAEYHVDVSGDAL